MSEPRTNASESGEPASPPGQEGARQTPPESAVVGERGIASINRARSLQSRISNLLALALMMGLGLGLLTWYYSQTYTRRVHLRQAAQSASQARAQGDMPLPPLGPIDPPAVARAPVAPSAPSAPMMASLLGPAPPIPSASLSDSPVLLTARTTSAAHPSETSRALARRLAGPVFSAPDAGGGVSESSASQGAATSGAVATDVSVVDSGTDHRIDGASAGGDSGPMARLLSPTVTPAVRASVLPSEDLLLPKGAFIDCTLETAIDSSLPGLTTCITATDTFSADGRVVLLERGTKLVGETQGVVQQGSSRVFVLWTEARTPTGVVVPLASPGTDELGRSGLPGTVNRHFFERFGAAMLISIIDGGVAAEVADHSSGGVMVYDPTASTDVMTDVLKSTVDIPPTVMKRNGDRIQVLVARDLDFRSVYALRPVGAH